MNVRLFQVDAFTTEKFQGNPAGIILDAEGLSGSQMQAIARELNNTESAFVSPPDGKDHDLRVRFFTPTTEIPMCGHNTVALHFVRAMEGEASVGLQKQKTGAGIIPVEISKHGASYRITMTQGKAEFDTPISAAARAELLSALGVAADAIDEKCPIQVVSTGNRKMMLGLKSRKTLDQLTPVYDALSRLGKTFDCTGYYLFTFDSGDSKVLTSGRMFAPQIGINEDPVTGMAIAPLGSYLVKNNLVATDGKQFSFVARQGEAMKRLGLAYVEVTIDQGIPIQVRVGGDAVIVFSTTLSI